jgi:hypothetical protein
MLPAKVGKWQSLCAESALEKHLAKTGTNKDLADNLAHEPLFILIPTSDPKILNVAGPARILFRFAKASRE